MLCGSVKVNTEVIVEIKLQLNTEDKPYSLSKHGVKAAEWLAAAEGGAGGGGVSTAGGSGREPS